MVFTFIHLQYTSPQNPSKAAVRIGALIKDRHRDTESLKYLLAVHYKVRHKHVDPIRLSEEIKSSRHDPTAGLCGGPARISTPSAS
ncbi:hypothetical protein ACTXT7_003050 [Hymenolepis weldensis]